MSRGGNKKKRFIPNRMRQNKPSKQITLKDKLHQIYYGTINLDTTCQGRCECCKVAMPQMNYCEFSQLVNEIWDTTSKSDKIELICKSIEYFFHNQFEEWGMESLVKPCMLLSEDGKCKYYDSRPMNCRIYGLWPEDIYKERVDKFEDAYEGMLKREELPLNKQCPYVKRVDESKPLTEEVIDALFEQLNELDSRLGNFSKLQLEQRENYRTFHDWLLFKVYGEDWLVKLTSFIMAANKDAMIDLIEQLKKATREQLAKNLPDIRRK
jgi:Fe-S-cluster containining protein